MCKTLLFVCAVLGGTQALPVYWWGGRELETGTCGRELWTGNWGQGTWYRKLAAGNWDRTLVTVSVVIYLVWHGLTLTISRQHCWKLGTPFVWSNWAPPCSGFPNHACLPFARASDEPACWLPKPLQQ